MPDRLSRRFSSAAFLLAVSFGFSSPALAGFQWVAPQDAASAPPMDMPQEILVPSASPSFAPAPMMPMQPMVAVPAPAPEVGPEIISPLVIDSPPVIGGVPDARLGDPVVIGFAKSVPLPVALRQILPSGYAFSVDQDVDMGTLVSFQGGRPWRDTLRDSLAPAGLSMREDGQMVMVGHTRIAAVAAPVVAPIVAPAPAMMAPAPVMAPAAVMAPAPVMAPSTIYRDGMAPRNLAVTSMAPMPQPVMVSPPIVVPVPADPVRIDNTKDTSDIWMAERGQHLRHVLEEWSRRANVEFNWLSEYDYPLQASVSFSGNFETAVRSLLAGFEDAHPQPTAELHSNPNIGQMVLVVRARGNTNNN